jgi:phage terminase small subunit
MIPETLPAASTAITPTKLSDRHEQFVQELLRNGGCLSDAYRAVYPGCTSREAVWAAATRLRARQDVQARIAELTAVAAERALIRPMELLRELAEIIAADPAELARVVIDPCAKCWPDDALGAAVDRALAGQAEMPDRHAPQPDCPTCRGRGVSSVVHTPTDALRGPARRLYQGAKTKSDGSVEVQCIDQLAARRELHELLGMKVSRSESKSLNVNMNVPAPAAVSAEDVLREFHALRDVTPR